MFKKLFVSFMSIVIFMSSCFVSGIQPSSNTNISAGKYCESLAGNKVITMDCSKFDSPLFNSNFMFGLRKFKNTFIIYNFNIKMCKNIDKSLLKFVKYKRKKPELKLNLKKEVIEKLKSGATGVLTLTKNTRNNKCMGLDVDFTINKNENKAVIPTQEEYKSCFSADVFMSIYFFVIICSACIVLKASF